MGIDPGVARLGYGIIKKPRIKKGKLKALDYECIITDPKLSPGERLKKIDKAINKLIKKYKPDLICVENIYFFKNLKTAMPVSQVKGIILLAAAKKKIPVCEITPLEVKMTLTGYGKADKEQLQKMVERLIIFKKPIKLDDTADALGIAICGALKMEREKIIKKNLSIKA